MLWPWNSQRLPDELREFFAHSPVFSYTHDTVGQWTHSRGMFIGGGGIPSAEVDGVIHELAHLVEIDDGRCHLAQWGLASREAMGARTRGGIDREVRVAGYQMVVTRSLLHRDVAWTVFASIANLPGCEFIPSTRPVRWVRDQAEEFARGIDYGIFRAEFDRKLRILETRFSG